MPPLVSVVVRSYKRPGPLRELLARLRRQTYDPFEIVIVEQSDDPELGADISALGDPRIHVLVRPPLGAAGARNEGVRHARGEILAFIDDDDLPFADDWIAAHVANYDDPLCMGVSGRLTRREDRPDPVRFPRLVRWLAFHYTILRDPVTLPFGSLRKEGITFYVGNNFSVRRSLVARIGGWDEVGLGCGEEQSFAFKYERSRRPGEYMVYDPRSAVYRRLGVDGGLDRRTRPGWHLSELRGRIRYYHQVVGHYFPWRYRLLFPRYLVRPAERVTAWIWCADNAWRTVLDRCRATRDVWAALPRMTLDYVGDDRTDVRRVPHLSMPGQQAPESQ
ncbi:MAG: glycosyltransferase family 2 protein [Deltaproteobacteria bacterium]|nr:glycosyltransferase family 2 protein [Deltaproteobacteria bacterium]